MSHALASQVKGTSGSKLFAWLAPKLKGTLKLAVPISFKVLKGTLKVAMLFSFGVLSL